MTALNRVPSLLSRAGTASALTARRRGRQPCGPGAASGRRGRDFGDEGPPGRGVQEGLARTSTAPPARDRFDCSGLTLYSFKKAGRQAAAYRGRSSTTSTHHISAPPAGPATWCSSTRAGTSTTSASTPGRARSGTPRKTGEGATGEDLDQQRLVRPGRHDLPEGDGTRCHPLRRNPRPVARRGGLRSARRPATGSALLRGTAARTGTAHGDRPIDRPSCRPPGWAGRGPCRRTRRSANG